MKKSIFALVLAAIMLAAMVFVVAPKAEAATTAHKDGKAAHCACAGVAAKKGDHKCDDKAEWKAVTDWADLKLQINRVAAGNSGYFYLTQDVNMDSLVTTNVGSKVYICFNGFTINASNKISVLGELSFCDCKGGGGVKATIGTGAQFVYAYGNSTVNVYGGTFTVAGPGRCFDMNPNSSTSVKGADGVFPSAGPNFLNIYGGTITRATEAAVEDYLIYARTKPDATTINIYGGVIDGNGVASTVGMICVESPAAIMNVKGGTIKNGVSTAGGGANIASMGTLNISGGKIIDGKGPNGANIYSSGTLNITGGTVSGGVAEKAGGNLYIQGGTVNISGGTVTKGTANGTSGSLLGGGNIHIRMGVVNITGGTVSDGAAVASGGNIYVYVQKSETSELNISGGTVSGGEAKLSGGNIFAANLAGEAVGAKVTISGGTISSGKALGEGGGGNGGNIYVEKCELNITGGNFVGGTAAVYGGSLCIAAVTNDVTISNAKFTGGIALGKFGGNIYYNNKNKTLALTNVTLTGGVAANHGGNLYVNNVKTGATLTDCTIKDGVAPVGGGISGSGKYAVNIILVGKMTCSGNVNGDVGIYIATEGNTVVNSDGLTDGKVAIYAGEATVIGVGTGKNLVPYHSTQEIKAEGGKLYLQGKGGNVVSVDGKGYATMADGAAAIKDGSEVVIMIGTAGQVLEVKENATIDFNGCKIDGVSIAAGKTLNGIDSSTNKYDDTAVTNVAITGEGKVAPITVTTGTIRKYIAIENGGKYSFHRFYVGITKNTLHTGTKGIGVVATFAGTPAVKALLKDAKAFGVEMNTANDFTGTNTAFASSADFTSGKSGATKNNVRAIVDNYLLTQDAAEAVQYARAYLELKDGTKLYSAVATVDAKVVLKAIDVSAAALSAGEKKSVQDMINGLSWNLPNAWELTKFTKQ